LRTCAAEKGASQYYTCDDVLGPASNTIEETDEVLDYDAENSRIATAALQLLQQSHSHVIGATLTDDILRQGTSIRPPCRFQHVPLENGVLVILDVAHNPPAMENLVRKLRKTFPDRRFRIVVGMSADKDLHLCGQSVLEMVEGDASRIHLVEAAHPRAAKIQDMLEATHLDGSAVYDVDDPSVTKQIRTATELALQNNELLVVCGSVFLMAEAREALGFDEPRDSDYIAEMAGAGVRYAQDNFGNTTTNVGSIKN